MLRLLLAALAVILLPAAASAAPPPEGTMIRVRTLLCDTAEQLTSIIRAAQEANDFAAGEARFKELFATRNAVGEPTCAAGVYAGLVAAVEPLGAAPWRDGQLSDVFAVTIVTPRAAGTLLWAERIGEQPPIAPTGRGA